MAAVVMVAADMAVDMRSAAIRVDTQWVDIRQAGMRVDMPVAVMSLDTAAVATTAADRSMTAATAITGLAASFPSSAVLSMASLVAATDGARRRRDGGGGCSWLELQPLYFAGVGDEIGLRTRSQTVLRAAGVRD